jgi:hypothetical protein
MTQYRRLLLLILGAHQASGLSFQYDWYSWMILMTY